MDSVNDLIAYLETRDGDKVLDLGCGAGGIAEYLSDTTGAGSGLSNGILGYAEKSEDELAFVFAGDTSRFHTTFAYDQSNDIWYWTMDSEKEEGQFHAFARLTMSRR